MQRATTAMKKAPISRGLWLTNLETAWLLFLLGRSLLGGGLFCGLLGCVLHRLILPNVKFATSCKIAA